MAYKIAIASGKGGTGKTTVSVNLYHFLREKLGNHVGLVDCDVEEPNDMIFYPSASLVEEKEVTQPVPQIDTTKCTFCKKCVAYCAFNAIVMIPAQKYASVDKTLCHSCGACLVACQNDAITELPDKIGDICLYQTNEGASIYEGRLKVGSAMQTMLIGKLKEAVENSADVILYDAPPGTSCPVVETISEVDYVVLVTEPTLFGLHDLKLMVALLRKMNRNFGVIVNKAGLGNRDVYAFLEEENIDLIGEIPFSRNYAAAYARGNLFDIIPENIRSEYGNIIQKLNLQIPVQ